MRGQVNDAARRERGADALFARTLADNEPGSGEGGPRTAVSMRGLGRRVCLKKTAP
jgi:hypothetical protein